MREQSDVVERALGYPYAVPSGSFALAGERVVELEAIEVDRSTRAPLLAYGSNASPGVLARKLAPAGDEPVPVLRAELSDFDVVYSAHIAAYGSVPATLRRSPGTVAPAFVAYLTSEQLRLVSKSEPNYTLGRLPHASCRLETGERLGAPAFLSRHGSLLAGGSEIALAGVRARGRRFPAMSQREVLKHVRDVLCPGRDLDRFVLDCVSGQVSSAGLDSAEAP